MGREEGAGAVGVSSSSAILCSDSKYRSTASFCAFISSLISRCTCRSFGESWGHGGGGGEGEGIAEADGCAGGRASSRGTECCPTECCCIPEGHEGCALLPPVAQSAFPPDH